MSSNLSEPNLDNTSGHPEPLLMLWLIRILMSLGGRRGFIGKAGFDNDLIASAIGLDAYALAEDKCSPEKLLTELRRVQIEIEASCSSAQASTVLRTNVERLAKLVLLNEVECRILEFIIVLNADRELDDCADYLGAVRGAKLYRIIATILGLLEPDVRKALSGDSVLVRSGLLAIDRKGPNLLRNKIDLLSSDFAERMLCEEFDISALLKGSLVESSYGHLVLSDYVHIQASLDMLIPFLRNVTENKKKGVNIFIHGSPGTGKSQLAKLLARQLEQNLFEVASEDEHCNVLDAERRLRAFTTAQNLLSQQKAIILFDEVEDVFNNGNTGEGKKSTAQLHKAWINRLLEENPVPTLWLSNSIEKLDPAFIRRFDMIIEVPIPSRSHRQNILRNECGSMIGEENIVRLSGVVALAPAVVSRAASVVRSLGQNVDGEQAERAFCNLVSNTLKAQGHQGIGGDDPNRLPERYDPNFIQSDVDLVQITNGLIHAKAGRLCLYGPPGTGKTAYARWLSEQLDVPLLVKRVSDLVSPYVGQTERLIAKAFREAEQDEALLLIDEADSFLRDRQTLGQSWEVTAVNEMLTQMESFSGVFVASTNLMASLDQAALRRFDLKVKFDYMTPDQSFLLLANCSRELRLSAPDEEVRTRLSRMPNLTPGDFATVVRQHRFRPIMNVMALVDRLNVECSVKEPVHRPIGFIQ